MPESPDNYEQHPHLPSGYWTGFYVYYHSQERHEMLLMLDFINGNISGNGQDDVGAFTFEGRYDLTSMTCRFMNTIAHIKSIIMDRSMKMVYGANGILYTIPAWASMKIPSTSLCLNSDSSSLVDFTSGHAIKNSLPTKWPSEN